jgi:hypothetical protein
MSLYTPEPRAISSRKTMSSPWSVLPLYLNLTLKYTQATSISWQQEKHIPMTWICCARGWETICYWDLSIRPFFFPSSRMQTFHIRLGNNFTKANHNLVSHFPWKRRDFSSSRMRTFHIRLGNNFTKASHNLVSHFPRKRKDFSSSRMQTFHIRLGNNFTKASHNLVSHFPWKRKENNRRKVPACTTGRKVQPVVKPGNGRAKSGGGEETTSGRNQNAYIKWEMEG